MSARPYHAPRLIGRGLRKILFPWAIALATGLDYFDNTLFSFFTRYISGGIHASPDELVWSTSAYAVGSVLGILQQQWWVERLGYRRYVAASLLLFAGGSLAAAWSDSSLQLAFARGVQGYFIGHMMGTCRILIQVSFTPVQRPAATRVFLLLILAATAAAPLVGGDLLAVFEWRALFYCLALAGAAIGALALVAVPHVGRLHPDRRGEAHLWPYLVFAFAQGALQIVMQQVRFEFFGASPGLAILTLAGLLALAWFFWHQWHHPQPLIRLQALRQKTFQVGMLLYIGFYYTSSTLGFLVSRFLEGGLGYPVEVSGRLVGFTSFAALPMAYAYFRYSKHAPHKKWLIALGFGVAVLIGEWMAHLPPRVSMGWLVPPLLLRGLLLLFIALPVANVTFRIFAPEEFTHSYRLKNIVRQLTLSFSTASIIIFERHRLALHETRLAEAVNSANLVYPQALAGLVGYFQGLGHSASEAAVMARVVLHRMAAQQASFLGALDGFHVVIAVAVCAGLFALWQEQVD